MPNLPWYAIPWTSYPVECTSRTYLQESQVEWGRLELGFSICHGSGQEGKQGLLCDAQHGEDGAGLLRSYKSTHVIVVHRVLSTSRVHHNDIGA